MKATHNPSKGATQTSDRQGVTPLEHETRPTVSTEAAAHYLHVTPQRMRLHACLGTGPLVPRRVNGRLHWSTQQIRELLGVAEGVAVIEQDDHAEAPSVLPQSVQDGHESKPVKEAPEAMSDSSTASDDTSEPLGMCNWGKPWPGIEAEALIWYRSGATPAPASIDEETAQEDQPGTAATSDAGHATEPCRTAIADSDKSKSIEEGVAS